MAGSEITRSSNLTDPRKELAAILSHPPPELAYLVARARSEGRHSAFHDPSGFYPWRWPSEPPTYAKLVDMITKLTDGL